MTAEPDSPRWVEALLGWPGAALAFAWGFAEGTLFFIVPDVLFTLTTALHPKRGAQQLALAVAGALLAGNVMYLWAVSRPAPARSVVASVPYVGEAMLAATESRLASHGARALFDRPLGGVPYKVYAVLAPARFSRARFLLCSVPARAERMLLSWIPVACIAYALRRLPGPRRRRVVVTAHALAWIGVYAFYWCKLGSN